MEQRDLPQARLVPRAVLGHVRAAAHGTSGWIWTQWRRIEPQALALALTAIGALAVLGITLAIAQSAISVRPPPEPRPTVIYLMRAPGPSTDQVRAAIQTLGAAQGNVEVCEAGPR